jgi:hypothetical protein
MRTKIVLPVRFTSLGEAVQTSTRELSEEGAFVRCVDPPMMGSQVMLSIQLPGGEPADVGVEVREVDLDPGDSGFFGTFVEPSDIFLARVHRAINLPAPPVKRSPSLATMPTRGCVRREGQHLLSNLVVKLGGRGVEPGVFALDISATGLFVLMPNPPEVDEVLQLKLELPDQLPAVKVLGLVVRRVSPGEAARLKRVPGAGLVFVGGGDDFRKRYDAYLALLDRPKL